MSIAGGQRMPLPKSCFGRGIFLSVAFRISAAAAAHTAALMLERASAFRAELRTVLGRFWRFRRTGCARRIRRGNRQALLERDHVGRLFDDARDRVRAGGALHTRVTNGRRTADAAELVEDFVDRHAGTQRDRREPRRRLRLRRAAALPVEVNTSQIPCSS